MRKIIVFNMVSIDGYFAGPNDDISWHNVTDGEFNDFAIKQLEELGTLIFGHTTYNLMASYWPTEEGVKDDPTVAAYMNKLPKIVFSKTLKDPTWENTKVFDKITSENVIAWKEKPASPSQGGEGSDDKPAAIFGSGEIVQQFANLGLIDEYRLMINPVILGAGKSLFKGVKQEKLKLIKTHEFKNGNILLYYQPTS